MRHANFACLTNNFRDILCMFDIWCNKHLKLNEIFQKNEGDKCILELTNDILTDWANACDSESFVLQIASIYQWRKKMNSLYWHETRSFA